MQIRNYGVLIDVGVVTEVWDADSLYDCDYGGGPVCLVGWVRSAYECWGIGRGRSSQHRARYLVLSET